MNSQARRGGWYGAVAYLMWGVFPLYFRALDRSGPIEILVHRIAWSLVLCLAVTTAISGWTSVRAVLGDRRRVVLLGAASVTLAGNWGIYVAAVNSGHVIEASLGYYINPLVTVLLGVVVLRERLRRLQWAAVGVAAGAVTMLTVAHGSPPWISLGLALTFGFYGLLKNRVGGAVGALAGLTTETLIIAPVAVGVLLWFEFTGRGHFTADPPWQGLLLATSGAVTVAPLLLFAAAARRIPLSTLGLLQYLTPTLQLLCGVVVLGEHMPAVRWAGFGLVWVALVLLTTDTLLAHNRDRREAPAPGGDPVAA